MAHTIKHAVVTLKYPNVEEYEAAVSQIGDFPQISDVTTDDVELEITFTITNYS